MTIHPPTRGNRRQSLARTAWAAVGTALALASPASAQVAIDWFTIDGGGGRSSSGCVTIEGTIGQWDAAPALTGGTVTIEPGYWVPGLVPPACPADLIQDGVVNTLDLIRFLGRFSTSTTACGEADFNGDSVVNTVDLIFFLGRFSVPCPQ